MPEIVWEFNGKELENSKEIEIKHSKNKTSLTFQEAKIENNGYYTCRVKNELGSDRTRAQLTVTSKFLKIQIQKSRRDLIIEWIYFRSAAAFHQPVVYRSIELREFYQIATKWKQIFELSFA